MYVRGSLACPPAPSPPPPSSPRPDTDRRALPHHTPTSTTALVASATAAALGTCAASQQKYRRVMKRPQWGRAEMGGRRCALVAMDNTAMAAACRAPLTAMLRLQMCAACSCRCRCLSTAQQLLSQRSLCRHMDVRMDARMDARMNARVAARMAARTSHGSSHECSHLGCSHRPSRVCSQCLVPHSEGCAMCPLDPA